MPYALRVSNASFSDGVETLVEPFSLALQAGEAASLELPGPVEARVAARMCAGIVKPTSGTIYVGDFETRLQPPQAKRLVGFVDAKGFRGSDHAFRCEAAFRADVWGLDREAAIRRAQDVLLRLGRRDGYARAIALALIPEVSLVVLDCGTGYEEHVRELVPSAALVNACVSRSSLLPERSKART